MDEKKVAIFCAASTKVPDKYNEAAREVVRALHALNYTILSGGGAVGTMGAITDESVRLGGLHTAVLPRFMKGLENPAVKDVVWTETMAERKERMREGTCAAIALPGGTGTLEEIAEVMSKVALGHLDAPCILYNLGGYYDGLKSLLGRMIEAGLSSPQKQAGIRFADSLAEIQRIVEGA